MLSNSCAADLLNHNSERLLLHDLSMFNFSIDEDLIAQALEQGYLALQVFRSDVILPRVEKSTTRVSWVSR